MSEAEWLRLSGRCKGEAGGKEEGREGSSAVESVYIDNFQQQQCGNQLFQRKGEDRNLLERKKSCFKKKKKKDPHKTSHLSSRNVYKFRSTLVY